MRAMIIALCLSAMLCGAAVADEKPLWEFNILGINPRDFRDRSIIEIGAGAILSYVVHEMGHIVYAKYAGANQTWDIPRFTTHVTGAGNWSKSNWEWFGRAGWVAQTAVGYLLVSIPATRNSDITLGFNALSAAAGFTYSSGMHDRIQVDGSDLDHLEYGTQEAAVVTIVTSLYTYIALDKAE